jgi:hypothetical protein
MDFDDSRQGSVKALVVAGLVLLAMALGYSVGLQAGSSSSSSVTPEIRTQPEMRLGGAETVDFEVAHAGQT